MIGPKKMVVPVTWIVAVACQLSSPGAFAQSADLIVKSNPLKEAYYGDLHLHTNYSFDAYLGFARVDPDEAYRFAKGETVNYLGQPVRRREPLDFMAVTDHSEYMGVMNRLEDPTSEIARSELGKGLQALKAYFATLFTAEGRHYRSAVDPRPIPASAQELLDDVSVGKRQAPEAVNVAIASAWQRQIEFANRNNEPGKFTTLIAYEWTARVDGAALHRNVIFKGDSAPLPFTARDSLQPEDLWNWLSGIRKQGHEALAIPHNSNFSAGLMYGWVDSHGKPIDDSYAKTRLLNEPLAEISQNKGTSETHPLLSPNDEFADYQILKRSIGTSPYRTAGSYLRDALSRGLVFERKLGVNPFKYGFVGGSDLHGGLSISAQADFSGGHFGVNLGGGRPTKDEASTVLGGPGGQRSEGVARNLAPGNLTGVWAKSNTRSAIYDALRDRETFATTGTRLKIRFFGGWSFDKHLMQRRDGVAAAYAQGVPMGSDLPPKPRTARAPSFLVWAMKDPKSGNLDRVQLVKVWEENGHQQEKIFEVSWAGPAGQID